MKKLLGVMALVALLAAPAFAAPQLLISLGVRETAAGGGADVGIGNNAGTLGGIEWVNLDAATLNLDGTWQQFSFALTTGMTTTAFAGGTANGILDGAYGNIECIRIKAAPGTGTPGPIQLWIDDVANTTDASPLPPPPTTTLIASGFEANAVGAEVLFQEPSFSGSTSANVLAGGTSAVNADFALTGTQSYKVAFEFADSLDTRWLRLTTNGTGGLPSANPLVRFDQNSVVSFSILGVPEPTSLALLGVAALGLIRRRTR